MSDERQPVDYLRVSFRCRILCLVCVMLSWIVMLLLAVLSQLSSFPLEWLVMAACSWIQGLSVFFCCVFAFCGVAANSISGEGTSRNVSTILACIPLAIMGVAGTYMIS